MAMRIICLTCDDAMGALEHEDSWRCPTCRVKLSATQVMAQARGMFAVGPPSESEKRFRIELKI